LISDFIDVNDVHFYTAFQINSNPFTFTFVTTVNFVRISLKIFFERIVYD